MRTAQTRKNITKHTCVCQGPPSASTTVNAMSPSSPVKVSSGDEVLDGLIRDWLAWNVPGSADSTFAEGAMAAGDYGRLRAVMAKRLAFGTAGIRAKMGPG